ncbi:RIIa domain-containing protein 1 [Dromaius novaehollandiae]|uniref:RIIa domain-containing protein 1 n=1 Tax=Dromaius novaehollandiae TaxID=8790 RepID=UPI00311E7389
MAARPQQPGRPAPPQQSDCRLASESYLRAHPAVRLLLGGFLREVMLKRPENLLEFAAEYFTDPELPSKIQKQLEEPEQMD